MERSGIEVFGSRKPVLDRLESGDDFRQCGIVGTKRVDCPENLAERMVKALAIRVALSAGLLIFLFVS